MNEARSTLLAVVALVGATAASVHWLAGWTLLLALGGIVLVAAGAARTLTRPLQRLRVDAAQLVEGSLASVPTSASSGALHDVRVSLNELAKGGRKRARTAEQEREDLTALMDRMEEGVLALAPDGVLRVTNRAARAVLGLPADAKGPHISRVPRRELRAVLEAALQTSIRTRAVTVADRIVMVEANLLEDGLAIVSLRDVTDVRRLEEVRTDFVANASHELKTPLTAVRGFAETLLEDDAPPEVRKQFLGLIHDNTLRLQAIVEDLLDLSRLESGGWTPSREPIDVVDAVHQAWAEVVEMRGSTRNFEVSGEAAVVADHSGLLHVLRNLFDNALRHTPESGTIHIRLGAHVDDQVRITVEDDGSGIPPDALPRIFERFFRVDRARSRAHGGTGLGLAIVSHLTSRMGGSVEAESQFGVGTKIHVFLPAAPQIQTDGMNR